MDKKTITTAEENRRSDCCNAPVIGVNCDQTGRGEWQCTECKKMGVIASQVTAEENLIRISEDGELLEIARKAVEDTLIKFRDSRISQIRGNGLVIREKNGKESYVIRLGVEEAMRIGLKAIAKHLKVDSLQSISHESDEQK